MAVFINDLFDFFWLHTVPGNVLDVVVVPLRLQRPELHGLRVAQGTVGFDSSNAELDRAMIHRWLQVLSRPPHNEFDVER